MPAGWYAQGLGQDNLPIVWPIRHEYGPFKTREEARQHTALVDIRMSIKIPADFPVQPLKPGQEAKDKVTCGTCGLSWDDAIGTEWTPAPSGRCPFEYFHEPQPEQAKPNPESCIKLDLAFPVEVTQQGNNSFTVVYGKQVKTGLSYVQAAHQFGQCVFHALACAGKLENNT